MPLYDIIRKGATDSGYPDRVAVIYRDQPITYGELAIKVNRLASALRTRGIAKGDSVAVLLPNCPEFTITYFAVSALGAICVPANPQFKPAELAHIWCDSAVKMVFTIPPLIPVAQAALAEIGSTAGIITVRERDETPSGFTTIDELIAAGDNAPPDTSAVVDTDPAVCIYTSGTTGRPKGALLSHRNLIANCEQISRALDFHDTDNFLCVLPLFHSFAATVCQNTALYCGAKSTILEQFHPARVLESVALHRVTIFAAVPAMFGALLQLPSDTPFDFSSIRFAVSGGAPMPVAIMEAFEKRFGVAILEGDGPTECSPVTCVNPPAGPHKPASVGLPIPGVEMKIFDENDRELPDGEVGEIVVRGENVMLGYRNQPEETAAAMRSGWYHTGDLGRRDSDGYFFIVDRKKDMIIVGGLNVYPREIEEVLYSHPAVLDAAVLGVPDRKRGEEPVAIVALKPGHDVSALDLLRYCRERLANYKVPRRVVFRESLPRGGTGKVVKRLLRKEMEMEA
jgi:long-chain acyl-CoA synthetase